MSFFMFLWLYANKLKISFHNDFTYYFFCFSAVQNGLYTYTGQSRDTPVGIPDPQGTKIFHSPLSMLVIQKLSITKVRLIQSDGKKFVQFCLGNCKM